VKFRDEICKEKVRVYAVPFCCSVRKYVDLGKHDKTTSLRFIKIALRLNARRHFTLTSIGKFPFTFTIGSTTSFGTCKNTNIIFG
jgi:hypothetical protein